MAPVRVFQTSLLIMLLIRYWFGPSLFQAMICAEQNMFVHNALTGNMLVPPDKSMFTIYIFIVIIVVHAEMG